MYSVRLSEEVVPLSPFEVQTLSIISSIPSSGVDANLRTAKKAAMRTLSSAVDHKSRHICRETQRHFRHTRLPLYLEVHLNRSPTIHDIRDQLRALVHSEFHHLRFGELASDVHYIMEE